MKPLIAIVIFSLSINITSNGQTDSVIIRKFYQTWVYPDIKSKYTYGVLFDVRDSSILVTNTMKKDLLLSGNFGVSEISSDKIGMIAIKKSGKKVGKTIGALTGLGLGLIIDVAMLTHNSASHTGVSELDNTFNAIAVVGLTLIPLGSMVIGLTVGHLIDSGIKKQMSIKGDQSRFEDFRPRLSGYSLKYLTNGKIMPRGQFRKLAETVTDYDGNTYHLLALGGQVWLAENLKTTRYRNGDSIQEAPGRSEWKNLSAGAYCDNRNDTYLTGKFGRFYNRYAVEDSRKICPQGYHVATYREWASLILCMGGEENAAAGLRGTGTEMVFTSLGGYRDSNGAFTGTGESGQYWWSEESDMEIMIGLSIKVNSNKVEYIRKDAGKNLGLSVRCIRDY